MLIRKREGNLEEYQSSKIFNSIKKAFISMNVDIDDEAIEDMMKDIQLHEQITVEEIQDQIESVLIDWDFPEVAEDFKVYRGNHALLREGKMLTQINGLFDHTDEYLMKENANKKPELTNVQQSYLGGIASTYFCNTRLFPKYILEGHNKGAYHIHDIDMSAMPGITNCSLLNLKEALSNGTVMNETGIRPQSKFVTACTVATQIVQGVAGLQYGGITVTMTHLAPYLRMSDKKILKDMEKYGINDPDYHYDKYKEILTDGIQTFMYQVNSQYTTQGQTPFLTVNLYLNEASEEDKPYLADIIEEVLKQRIQGFEDRYGNWVAPAFPKLIYVLQEDNINPDGKYYYLTKLAAKCNSNRMVPDYISEKVMKEIHGYCYPSMGCRSFLSPWYDINGNVQFYGRNNLGVVSLNLAYIAAEALKSNIDFFELLDKYANLVHEAHKIRTKRICHTSIDCAPLLWRDGVFSRAKGESIKIGDIVKGGYASVSLGYAGLYECVKFLTGLNHWEDGMSFAMKIMQKLNDYCEKWTQEDNLKYGVYGTPMESGTYKFAMAVKSIMPEYDRLYITNSYHIPVFAKIDPFTKLTIEGKFQRLSKNGCISYIECADLTKNPEAIHSIQQCIYDNCMYAELNIKSCKCYSCGSEAPMAIDDDLNWYCTKCGEKRPSKLRHLYRICGYASTSDSNAGRTSDVKDRYIHLDNHE